MAEDFDAVDVLIVLSGAVIAIGMISFWGRRGYPGIAVATAFAFGIFPVSAAHAVRHGRKIRRREEE